MATTNSQAAAGAALWLETVIPAINTALKPLDPIEQMHFMAGVIGAMSNTLAATYGADDAVALLQAAAKRAVSTQEGT